MIKFVAKKRKSNMTLSNWLTNEELREFIVMRDKEKDASTEEAIHLLTRRKTCYEYVQPAIDDELEMRGETDDEMKYASPSKTTLIHVVMTTDG